MRNRKDQFAILICVGLIAIILISMVNLPMISALPTDTQYCDTEDCHDNDEPTTWIDLSEYSQTAGEITYFVTGSDNYIGEEGWGVFDPLINNVANANNSGYFTLPKDGRTYRAFWVDNETDLGPGSAYVDFIPTDTTPHDLVLTGDTKVKAGTSHDYTFSSIDDEGQDIFYKLEWGDGSDTDWFGPYESGEEDSKSHSWSEDGTYGITLHARDEYGAESTKTLIVYVPKNKAFNYNFNLLDLLLDKFPMIQRLLSFPFLNRLLFQ